MARRKSTASTGSDVPNVDVDEAKVEVSTESTKATTQDTILGLIVIAVGAVLLWFIGKWIFTTLFGGGGVLYAVISPILVIAVLAAGLGILVPLPIFLGSRIVAVVALLVMLFWGVPAVQSLRTPEQVAKEAKNDAPADTAANDASYSDTAVKAAAMSAVKRKLADDRSARFRDVSVVIQDSGTKAVCGEVNAKNRAGGYIGYQHFISAGTDEFTWLEEEMPDFASAWNQICVR